MDADTYPRQDVQEALKPFVCVHVNAESDGEGRQTAKEYGVNSYPRLMVLDPLGRKLVEIRGKPNAENFADDIAYDLHNGMATAAEAGDYKTAAPKMAVLRRWFEGTKARAAADQWYAQLEPRPEFKAAWDEATKALEADLAKAKANAEKAKEAAERARAEAEVRERKGLMDQAAEHSKKNRRKEAIDCWQKVVQRWPDSEEAKTARGKLKFFGVKVEEPKK